MGEFNNWLSDFLRLQTELKELLSSLQRQEITPREVINRIERGGANATSMATRLYTMQADADSWRLAKVGGMIQRLPAEYNHVACCKAGARMYLQESAIYVVAADIFVDLQAWNDASECHEKVGGILIRAEDHLAELKWYRRLFSRDAGKISGIEGIKSYIRSVKDTTCVVESSLKIQEVDGVNGDITYFNENVIADVVRKILKSESGRADGLSKSTLSRARHALLRLQLDTTRFKSSWSILYALEKIAISSAVLDWGRFQKYNGHPSASLLRDDALRALNSANRYRWDRWCYVPWFGMKWMYGTLSGEVGPAWTKVLPTGNELATIRVQLGEWLGNRDDDYDI